MEGVPKTGQNMSSTQQWLRENTRFYTNSSRTYADVDAVLPRYPSLRPKTDVYSLVRPDLRLNRPLTTTSV